MYMTGEKAATVASASVSDNGTNIIFVTGASRSGTTMLARLLGANTEILALNELHFFGSMWDPVNRPESLAGSGIQEMAAVLLARQARGLWGGKPTQEERDDARDIVERLAPHDCHPAGVFSATLRQMAQASGGKKIACEQTPRNIFYAETLLQLFPSSRVIHIVRDPRAVLASQKNRWKLRKLGADHLPRREVLRNKVNYHPITMTRLWMKATEEASRLQKLDRFAVVRFEDLASEPEETTRRICEFIGVGFEPAMLDLPRWGSSNLEHSSAEKGVSKQVVDEWKKALPVGHAMICERMAKSLMQRFDYPLEFAGTRSSLFMMGALAYYPLHAAAVLAFNPRRAWVQLKALRRSAG